MKLKFIINHNQSQHLRTLELLAFNFHITFIWLLWQKKIETLPADFNEGLRKEIYRTIV